MSEMLYRFEMRKINLKEGEIYDLAIKVNRRSVKIISQTATSIKVCCEYRTQGRERWTPIYCWISKKSILDYKKVKTK
jgi:predicted DNA-binding antitoxin AbrB/MazE fold protein